MINKMQKNDADVKRRKDDEYRFDQCKMLINHPLDVRETKVEKINGAST